MRAKAPFSQLVNIGAVMLLLAALVALYFAPRRDPSLASRAPASSPPLAPPSLDSQIR